MVLRGLLAGGVVGVLGHRGLSILWAPLAAVLAAALGTFVLAARGAPFSLPALALAAICAAGAHLASRRGFRIVVESSLVLFVVLSHLWLCGLLPGVYRQAVPRIDAKIDREPAPETYEFDGRVYLRTYYLMKQGMPFYQAFGTAHAGDRRHDGPPAQKLNYREPLLYEIWRWLPGHTGESLRVWFVVYSIAVLLAAYALARTFVGPGPALLSPILLSGYFTAATWSTWFLFSELWSGGAAVIALLALVRGRWWMGGLLVTATIALRELMIFLIPAYAVAWLLDGKRRETRLALAAALVAPALALGIHWLVAPGALIHSGGDLSPWMQGGLQTLMAALAFSSDFIANGHAVLLAAPVAALVGASLARPRWRAGLLLTAIVLPLIGLYAVSAGEYGYYWGAILQPIVIAVAPLSLQRFDPAETRSD